MKPEAPIWMTWDGDRDCPGNPGRLFGCRCQSHRPDLYYGSAKVYHSPEHGVTMSLATSGTYVVPVGVPSGYGSGTAR